MVSSTIILGIESSCDETAAAVLKKEGQKITILSHIISSSASLQSKYGGIIPEQAAREQLKSIIPVITEALEQANFIPENLDSIAITQGPGLIGSLLVGVETAKTLSLVWNKPLIPVNHLIGHFYANWITPTEQPTTDKPNSENRYLKTDNWQTPQFPCLGLLVSGGHSDLVLFQNHGKYKYLGGTRDDAAGECFDKCARLLGLPYPGGPQISKLAKTGNPKKYNLPRPMSDSDDYDFSFSGLKTAVSTLINSLPRDTRDTRGTLLNDLCASIEQAIIDSLVNKTLKALKQTGVKTLIVAGGVAANQKLTQELKNQLPATTNLFIPPPILCTDNAAMIASAAFFLKPIDPQKIQANPNLSLAY